MDKSGCLDNDIHDFHEKKRREVAWEEHKAAEIIRPSRDLPNF